MTRIKILYVVSAMAVLGLAVVSYLYLAPALFYIGLSDFYDIAPLVPEQCTAVVADAAVAFSALYTYVAWAVAFVLLVLGSFLSWRASTRS